MDAVIFRTEAAIAHTARATAHVEAVIVHTAPGAIKPPFIPTATAHEKIAKLFLNSC